MTTSPEQLEEINVRVRKIYNDINNLAIDLARKYQFCTDQTVVSCAEAMCHLLNICTQVYIERPELAPEYMAGTNWQKVAERDRRFKKSRDAYMDMVERKGRRKRKRLNNPKKKGVAGNSWKG